MKVSSNFKVISFTYDVTVDGGAVGVYNSGTAVPLNALLLFAQYKILIPFVGAAGAMLEMGIDGNTPVFTKGAPIDPTVLPVGVWQDGGFSSYNSPASLVFTTITVDAFTQGKLICVIPFVESPL